MKLTKLMLSACVAALALVSCQKEGPSVPVETKVKSVDVSIANMILTKSESSAIAKGTKVNLKNFKIFLTDNAYYRCKGFIPFRGSGLYKSCSRCQYG